MIELIPEFNLLEPSLFNHNLAEEELLSLNNLAKLAQLLPKDMIESELKHPIYDDNLTSKKSIASLIHNIRENDSYIFLRNVEQVLIYEKLMRRLIKDLSGMNIINEDEIINPMSFIFISSPKKIAPFHIDPEHNFLFQIKGEKSFYLNNRLNNKIISDNELSNFYKDEINFKLKFKEHYNNSMQKYKLFNGNGIYVPVTFPHYVVNGDTYSISYSLTFRSEFCVNHRNKYLSI